MDARIYVVGGSERRRSDRMRSGVSSTIRGATSHAIEVTVLDISRHGFRCEGDLTLRQGDDVVLGVEARGSIAAVVRWREGRQMGCEFIIPLSARDIHGVFRGNVADDDGTPSPAPRG